MHLHVRPFDKDRGNWIFNIVDNKGKVYLQFYSSYKDVRKDCGIENPSILGSAILDILGTPPISILTPKHISTYPLKLSWDKDSTFVEIDDGELSYRDPDKVKYI